MTQLTRTTHPHGQALVFWDFDGCLPSADASGYDIVNSLRKVLEPFCASLGQVKAFLNLAKAKKTHLRLLNELYGSAVQLVDCSANDVKGASAQAMVVDRGLYPSLVPQQANLQQSSPPALTDLPLSPSTVAVLRNRRYAVCTMTPEADGGPSLLSDTTLALPWRHEEGPKLVTHRQIATPVSSTAATTATEGPEVKAWVKAARPAKELDTSAVKARLEGWANGWDEITPSPTMTTTSLPSPPLRPTTLKQIVRPTPLRPKAPVQPEVKLSWSSLRARREETNDWLAQTMPAVAKPKPAAAVVGSIALDSKAATKPVTIGLPILRPLSPKLAKAILSNKQLLVRIARTLASISFQRQAALLPMLLVSRRFRDILEPISYQRLHIDGVPPLLRLGRGGQTRLLGHLRALEVDLPDDAAVKLIELCHTTLISLHLIRGNWSKSPPLAAPPPASLRAVLVRSPRLLYLTVSSTSTSTELPFGWLLVDPPSTPLFHLRTLHIDRLAGRPRPLYGSQLPLPPLIQPIASASPSWPGIVTSQPGIVFPLVEQITLSHSHIASDEFARLCLALPSCRLLCLVDCSIPPSTILSGVSNGTKMTIEVVFEKKEVPKMWRERAAVDMAKKLCAVAGVELRV